MNEYTINWTIEVDANSPEEAANQALEIMRDPDSTATVFEVIEIGGNTVKMIDAAGLSRPVPELRRDN